MEINNSLMGIFLIAEKCSNKYNVKWQIGSDKYFKLFFFTLP